MADPYLYANGTLRNKLGLRDASVLLEAEARLTAIRLAELRAGEADSEGGDTRPFGAERLRFTHHHIFQDLYEWAGHYRITALGKAAEEGEPVRWFAPPETIEARLEALFAALAREGESKTCERRTFADRAGSYFAHLNSIHPFREGNGRASRVFFSALAHAAGYDLAFDVVSQERMVAVSIEAHAGSSEGMKQLFREISDPERTRHLRTAISYLDSKGFDWNSRYLIATVSGHRYSGHLVAIGEESFMMHDGTRILVGRTSDLLRQSRTLPKPGARIGFMTGEDEGARASEHEGKTTSAGAGR